MLRGDIGASVANTLNERFRKSSNEPIKSASKNGCSINGQQRVRLDNLSKLFSAMDPNSLREGVLQRHGPNRCQ